MLVVDWERYINDIISRIVFHRVEIMLYFRIGLVVVAVVHDADNVVVDV